MLAIKIQRDDVKPGGRGVLGKDVVDLLNCFPAIGTQIGAVLLKPPAIGANIMIIMVNSPHTGQKAEGSKIVIQGRKE
jgi:hypothetical protein